MGYDLAVIFVIGLTGPFVIFFAPIIILKYCRKANCYNIAVVASTVLVVGIQLIVISRSLSPSTEATNTTINAWLCVIGQKYFGNLFLGHHLPYRFSPWLMFGLLVAFQAYVVLQCAGDARNRRLIIVFTYVQLAILLATFYKFRPYPEALIPPGNGPRYFYVPYVMAAWSLIICLAPGRTRNRLIIGLLLAAMVTSSLISKFHSKPFRDYDWSRFSGFIGKADNLTIPINPPGWEINIQTKHLD